MDRTRPRYQDFVNELARGEAFGVFIDDSGSPGLSSGELHPQRKSWVAVIVPPHQMGEVFAQFPRALSAVAELTHGASEFHFADVYAGRKAFEHVDLQIRLSLFRFMAWVFDHYRFPVFVQTIDPDTLPAIRAKAKWPDKFGLLRLSRHDDFALFLLLMRVLAYLQGLSLPNASARVFVDEGRLKNGVAFGFPKLAPTFRDGLICFADSKAVLPLQLADFAAFVLNRWQLLWVKQSLTDLDKELLSILSPVAACFQNTERVEIHNPAGISSLKEGVN
jgi:hypothetical protein